MDISYILEFVVLADTKSFSATAYQMHISQATLSRHIQAMEHEAGHPLFIRSTRNVELSDYGQIYLPFARKISECVKSAETARKIYEEQSNSKTVIGISRYPDLYLTTELISGFRRNYPNIPIQIIEASLKELRQEFEAGHLHIISTSYAKWEKPPHTFLPAGESCLVAIIPKNHPLAEFERIPIRQLENVPLLVPEQISFTYQYLLYIFHQENINPDIVYQGNTSGAWHLLKEGMGIFIQDIAIAKAQIDENLSIRQLMPDISYTFGLEHQDNLTPNERIYVKYIAKALAAV